MALSGSFLRNLTSRGGESEPANSPSPSSAPFDARERLAMLDAIEEAGLGWFWASDANGHLTYLSASARTRFRSGCPVEGELLTALVESADDDPDSGMRPLAFLLRARSSFADLPVRLREAGPRDVWWALTGKPRHDEEGRFLGYRGSAKDISASYEQQRVSSRLARSDALTGLANRPRMEQRLERALEATRGLGRPCALMMLDLDRFKQVNDTLGHPAGDELLRQVAQRLRRVVPATAEIGRLGGDEFQILLPDQANREALQDLAGRLVQMISQPYGIENARAEIGTSIGIAVAPEDGAEAATLVKCADIALYAAKRGGRGQARFYSRDLVESSADRTALEADLRDALALGQLAMHYQPIVAAGGHEVQAFEALMRWHHPERGPVPPATFIPLAEESDLIQDLGEWGLRQACNDAMQWPEEMRVAVNISAQQFAMRGFADLVSDVLTDTGLAPGRLELEVTEAVFNGDETAREAMFGRLRRLGVALVLDDFGTGRSSLECLRRGPFGRVKIDRQFVSGCSGADSANSAIVAAIIALAHALGLKATAEGVEVLDEMQAVTGLGADQLQGFVFARPMPQADVLARFALGALRYEPSGPRRHRAERHSVFRRIGVIHEDYRYVAVMRNLSRTGAMIEGLLDVPVGTQLVLELGEGQLAVATVRRAQGAMQGVEFETPLVYDSANRLRTRHRVSSHDLAAAGLDGVTDAAAFDEAAEGGRSRPRFVQVDITAGSNRAA